MMLVLGVLLGAPIGGALLAGPAFRDLLGTVTWNLQYVLYLIRAQGGGTHYRMLPRPRPFRLLAHGTHEAPRARRTAITTEPSPTVEAAA